MKIHVTMSDQEFDQIEKYIDCTEWCNPMQDEFIFYNPSLPFRVMLAFYEITYYLEKE